MGPELIFGQIFDQIGFSRIKEPLFRYLVMSRLIFPVSKLKTIDYLRRFNGTELEIDAVYRYPDKLHRDQMLYVQQIGYDHAIRVSGNGLTAVFYDVTTLYFEAEDEDDLRIAGFSKDGKHNQPQIVLGLLVNASSFPLAYQIFEGNKFEGHTMIPVLEAFKAKYKVKQLVVVADAGLMSTKNVQQLSVAGYDFILAARIKNESEALKRQILALRLRDGESTMIDRHDHKLIVSYSLKRAKKDAYNREKGITRLEKLIKTGKLTKEQINNRGYNKFLKLKGQIEVVIDMTKCREDEKWDGLKGYATNTNLSKEVVITQYRQLYTIEKTFRISKTDLRIRPIYHYLQRRIESHICICFAACVLYKETERQLKELRSTFSVEKVIDIVKTIFEITVRMPHSNEKHTRLILKQEEQKALLSLFGQL